MGIKLGQYDMFPVRKPSKMRKELPKKQDKQQKPSENKDMENVFRMYLRLAIDEKESN